jgi:hypothetical protein
LRAPVRNAPILVRPQSVYRRLVTKPVSLHRLGQLPVDRRDLTARIGKYQRPIEAVTAEGFADDLREPYLSTGIRLSFPWTLLSLRA